MRGHIQIWFFSGILLLTYGVLIFATGLWELGIHRPRKRCSGSCTRRSGGAA